MCDLQAIASKIYDMQQAEGPAAVDLETDLDDSPKDLCKAFRLTARFCDYPSYPQTFLYNLHNLSTALDQVDCNDLEPNWPLFWLENAMFWRVWSLDASKIEVGGF